MKEDHWTRLQCSAGRRYHCLYICCVNSHQLAAINVFVGVWPANRVLHWISGPCGMSTAKEKSILDARAARARRLQKRRMAKLHRGERTSMLQISID